MDEKEELKQVGGWLAFFIFTLFANGIFSIFLIFSESIKGINVFTIFVYLVIASLPFLTIIFTDFKMLNI